MLVMFTLAAMCLVAPQAPMNAARADVLHARLRGRGTAMDVVLQSVCAAIAPTLVGVLADAYSLRTAFLVLVPLMGVSGILLLLAVGRTSARSAGCARSCAPRRSPTKAASLTASRSGPEVTRPRGDGAGTGGAVIEHGQLVEATAARRRSAHRRRLDLSYGPIQVLFDVQPARPGRRGARARRAQRCRQDDAAVRDRRAASTPSGAASSTPASTSPGCRPTSGSSSGSR